MKFSTSFLNFIFLFVFAISFSQRIERDSLRASFTYLLTSKPNNLYPDQIYKELFSLQISDNSSFFVSEKTLKIDSIYQNEIQKAINSGTNHIDMSGKSLPKTKSRFSIIQTNESVKFYSTIGMTVLYYTNPIIKNWKLIDENKLINTLKCKKAEVRYKGRDWVAWYSTEIPFSNGPFKFSGLPGLIVKITDKTGDYDFEIVKSIPSTSLKGKTVTINKLHYENAKLVTKQELYQAKENFRKNRAAYLESMGMDVTKEQKQILREKQKQNKLEKKGYNPIELE